MEISINWTGNSNEILVKVKILGFSILISWTSTGKNNIFICFYSKQHFKKLKILLLSAFVTIITFT